MAKKKETETAAATGNGQYVVYCKLPCGYSFPTPSGKVLVLNGSNHKGEYGGTLTVAGYGRTVVSTADWDYIMEVYGSLPVFNEKNPIIFAAESQTDGDDIAKEYGPTVKNGMEQRNPQAIVRQAERQADNVQPTEE